MFGSENLKKPSLPVHLPTSQGEGCDDFLYLVFQGLSGDGQFFSMSGGKMRGKVLREKPQKLKCLNDEMLDAEECFLILDIYWYLLLHKKCICSRRWTKETSAKMFLMMSSLLHIVYDVSWCVSIFYSSFHDFESCLIHLFFHSSRPPMFDHVCPSQPWSITKAIRNRQNRSYESSLANKPPNWRPSWSVPSMRSRLQCDCCIVYRAFYNLKDKLEPEKCTPNRRLSFEKS